MVTPPSASGGDGGALRDAGLRSRRPSQLCDGDGSVLRDVPRRSKWRWAPDAPRAKHIGTAGTSGLSRRHDHHHRSAHNHDDRSTNDYDHGGAHDNDHSGTYHDDYRPRPRPLPPRHHDTTTAPAHDHHRGAHDHHDRGANHY